MDLTRDVLDHEFPSRSVAVQLNHAAVSPIPRAAAEAISRYVSRLSTHGVIDWREWDAEAARLRALGARLLGAGPRVGGADSISIISGTSSALNLLANARELGRGRDDDVAFSPVERHRVAAEARGLLPELDVEAAGVARERPRGAEAGDPAADDADASPLAGQTAGSLSRSRR